MSINKSKNTLTFPVHVAAPDRKPMLVTPLTIAIHAENARHIADIGFRALGEGLKLDDHLAFRISNVAASTVHNALKSTYNAHEGMHDIELLSHGANPKLNIDWSGQGYWGLPKLRLVGNECVLEDQHGKCLYEDDHPIGLTDEQSAMGIIRPLNMDTLLGARILKEAYRTGILDFHDAISYSSLSVYTFIYHFIDTAPKNPVVNGDPAQYRESKFNQVTDKEQLIWQIARYFLDFGNYHSIASILNYLTTGKRDYQITTTPPQLKMWHDLHGLIADFEFTFKDTIQPKDTLTAGVMIGVSENYHPFSVYGQYYGSLTPGYVDFNFGAAFSETPDFQTTDKRLGWRLNGGIDIQAGPIGLALDGAIGSNDLYMQRILGIGQGDGGAVKGSININELPERNRDIIISGIEAGNIDGYKENGTIKYRKPNQIYYNDFFVSLLISAYVVFD